MTRPRLGIGSELLPLCLILACLGGTTLLIISLHEHSGSSRQKKASPSTSSLASVTKTPPKVPSPVVTLPPRGSDEEEEPEAAPEPSPPPPRPAEDPTRTAVAKLGGLEAEELLEARAADRRTTALEKSTAKALAEVERWKRREQTVKNQADALDQKTRAVEQEVDALELERDVLAKELEASKAALTRARTRSSYAVLPNRAPNGTWRRPIVIECHNGMATLQPQGLSFNLLELSGLMGERSSPITMAVVREMARIQGTTAPDGALTVPYVFFVVRPDGIRPFYDARSRLESLGIAFGYELVDQDMEIDFPDLDHPDEWDGSPSLRPFRGLADGALGGGGTRSATGSGSGRGHSSSRPGQAPEDFVWGSGRSQSQGNAGGSGPGFDRGGRGGSPGMDGLGEDLGRAFGAGGIASAPSSGTGASAHSLDMDRENEANQPGPGASRGGLAGTPGLPPPIAPRGNVSGNPPSASSGRPLQGDGSLPLAANGSPGAPSSGGRAQIPGRNQSSREEGRGQQPIASLPGQGNGMGDRPIVNPSSVAGASLMGRDPNEAVPFQPGGLLPGEPGAPSEEMLAQARQTKRQGQGQGRNLSGGGFAPSSPGTSMGSTNPGTTGVPNGSPGSLGMSDGGTSGGVSGGGGMAGAGSGGSGSPGGSGTPGGSARSGTGEPNELLEIEVPMEIVVACGPNGVVIHPGGYSLSRQALKRKDAPLAENLRRVVRLRQQVDPLIHPRPSIRFLIEPGGHETYVEARKQTVLSGLDWPTTLQVADSRILDFLPRERF